ncbi:MAG: bifunctional diaminohydroxyphosphoribosylaminopyrimidine deaminase/5-amino-6-(5-phosphoribosylamino)uracil reductase RibD, partial [Alphaproteobacteria bacterium]
MRAALALSRRALGNAWPNPAVGCVLVGAGGAVVGRGWTQAGGRPHAETEALRRAGSSAKGASAYVSLEPCDHHGRTPPCSKALIDAGIGRAVVAIEDPDARVSGKGIATLRAGGIETIVGVLAEDAEEINLGFFLKQRENRPLVTLKLATSLDARIATASGDSQWITGETARARAHLLRARHDAVAVGIGTALADDPQLTCRLPGLPTRAPARVVFDSQLRLPATSKLATGSGDGPVLVITGEGADKERAAPLQACGITVIEVERDADGRPDVAASLRVVADYGITRLLVEGGGILAASMLGADLVDRIAW